MNVPTELELKISSEDFEDLATHRRVSVVKKRSKYIESKLQEDHDVLTGVTNDGRRIPLKQVEGCYPWNSGVRKMPVIVFVKAYR